MKRRTRSSSAPEPLPLQAVTPQEEEEEDEDPRKKWQLVPASSAAAAERFGLPDGWLVEEIPRCSTSSRPERVDRYYIEPDTGQRFRSLVAVRRCLSGGQVAKQATVVKQATVDKQAILDKQATVDKQAILDEQATMQITPQTTRCSPSFVLPDGWKTWKKPRKNTMTIDRDKYYIEPGTGRRFRSLVAVERYLTEKNEHAPLQYYIEPGTGRRFRSLVAVERYLTEKNEHAPLQALIPADKLIVSSGCSGQKKKIPSLKIVSKNSLHSNDCNTTLNASRLNTYTSPAERSSSPKKRFTPKNSRTSQLNSSSRPPKVKWVLFDHLENEWNPFMDDSMVADSVKQKWSEIFKSTIYCENIRPPIF